MFFGWSSQPILLGSILALIVLSIFLQIIIGVLYQRLILETENMASTENRVLKQCKLKFSNCYEINEGSVNTPVFVEKFLNQLRLGYISVTKIAHLSGQLILLSTFLSGAAVCREIIIGQTIGRLLPYYMLSLAGLYLYFSVSSMVDINGKKEIAKTNIVDYFENHLVKHLILVKKQEMQPFLVLKQKDLIEEGNWTSLEMEHIKTGEQSALFGIMGFSMEEKQELEQLLEEYLI